MDRVLTIGRLAREVGVPTSTLRYYERAELLSPAARTEGNYRTYGPDALERVRFIRLAQEAGFSIEDIAALLNIRDGNTAPCTDVEALIESRIEQVRGRLKGLRKMERHLKESLKICRGSPDPNQCQVVASLTSRSRK